MKRQQQRHAIQIYPEGKGAFDRHMTRQAIEYIEKTASDTGTITHLCELIGVGYRRCIALLTQADLRDQFRINRKKDQ